MNLKRIFGKIKTELIVFLAFVVMRIPHLGWDIFNTDSWRWKARSYVFITKLTNLKLVETARSPHPGVSLMWINTVAIKIYHFITDLFRPGVDIASDPETFVFHFSLKFALVIVLGMLLAFSYYLLKKLTRKSWWSLFAVVLLGVEPFFLAHTRVLHLDALLSMFMFVSVLSLLCYFDSFRNLDGEVGSEFPKAKPSIPGRQVWRKSLKLSFFPSLPTYLSISAVFAGLALLTKSTALFIIPFSALVILILSGGSLKKRFCSSLQVTSYWLLITAATFVAAWPAMWVAPVQTLKLYFSGINVEGFAGHRHIILGTQTYNPGFGFYPFSFWIRVSPWFLLSLLVGLFAFFRNRSSKLLQTFRTKEGKTILISLLFAVLYYMFLSIPSKKLERYGITFFPFLAVLGGYALWKLKVISANLWSTQLKSAFFGFLIIFFIFFGFFVSVYKIHPDYLAYYNPLAGGYDFGVNAIHPRWYFGDRVLGNYFSEKEDPNDLVVACYNYAQLPPFVPCYVISLGATHEYAHADYIVVPVWREDRERELIDEHKVEFEKLIRVGPHPAYRVYRFTSF